MDASHPETDGGSGCSSPPFDLLCALCRSLYHKPVTTPCNHTFCGFCLRRMFELRKPGDSQAPPAERHRDCPMCRRSLLLTEVRPNEELDESVRQAFPAMYAQRGLEQEEDCARLAAQRLEYKRLFVGNLHILRAPQEGNMHDWTFFVRMETPAEEGEFIERVMVHLHPTFHPSTLVLREPPFTVRRLGWGYFLIRAEVTFKREWGGETMMVPWLLDFEGNGGMREIELELQHRPVTPVRTPAAGGEGGAAVRQGSAAAVADRVGVEIGQEVPEGREDMEEQEGGEEEEDEQESSSSSIDEDSYGSGRGEAGGDYDLGRFHAGGWASPHSTSGSEGDPSYDPEADAASGGPGSDAGEH